MYVIIFRNYRIEKTNLLWFFFFLKISRHFLWNFVPCYALDKIFTKNVLKSLKKRKIPLIFFCIGSLKYLFMSLVKIWGGTLWVWGWTFYFMSAIETIFCPGGGQDCTSKIKFSPSNHNIPTQIFTKYLFRFPSQR